MLNITILTGHLTKDFESKSISTKKGDMKEVVNGTIAVKDTHSEYPDYINFTAWSRWADVISKYTTKGSLLTLKGKWKKNKSTDKEGNTNYFDYLLVEEVELLESKDVTDNKRSKNEEAKAPFANTDKSSIHDMDAETFETFTDDNGTPF